VILTIGQVDIATVVDAMRNGAFDVLGKPFNERLVCATVERAIREDTERRRRNADDEAIRNRYWLLTAREREVAELVVAGLPSRGIAGVLQVGEKTVEVYRSRIKRKMKARNSADLARLLQCVNGGFNGNGHGPGAAVPELRAEVRHAAGK
jgi:FixJ family two-component response regulator